MKNGDIIRLHQTQTMEGIITHHFTSDDALLDTVEDLEAFPARLGEIVGPEDEYIRLPPVTYTEELSVTGRAIHFTGSTDEAGGCFDAARGTASNSRYVNNLFRSNGTAVLLVQVPSDVSLEFSGTRFQDNGIDIDNRCGHALELDEAVFE